MPLRADGLTDKGRIRLTNEDCFAIQAALGLCVVADGMGGHNAGEVAARIAVDSVVEYVTQEDARVRAPGPQAADASGATPHPRAWPFGYDRSLSPDGNLLRTAVHVANVQIREAALNSLDYAGMGTTIVAARVRDGLLSVAHVGDSRLYILAGRRLRQLTVDDSWMATILARDPGADRLLLEHHPMRNALTNVVGARLRTDVHVAEERLSGGTAAAVDRRRPRRAGRQPDRKVDAGGGRPARNRRVDDHRGAGPRQPRQLYGGRCAVRGVELTGFS